MASNTIMIEFDTDSIRQQIDPLIEVVKDNFNKFVIDNSSEIEKIRADHLAHQEEILAALSNHQNSLSDYKAQLVKDLDEEIKKIEQRLDKSIQMHQSQFDQIMNMYNSKIDSSLIKYEDNLREINERNKLILDEKIIKYLEDSTEIIVTKIANKFDETINLKMKEHTRNTQSMLSSNTQSITSIIRTICNIDNNKKG